ncbi:uncharacterized protein LOC126823971 [Patella vulgata]|uniref:uncharacterized protein LOC126823971 n=1 Tax=Patella vulgata TaxID=6465 RepID=UPI00218038F7|nr:uncharacterized protein LOC126823971 [Patella vulgata]
MATDILFFIPNIIGYIRIGLALISFILWNYPFYFLLFYCLSVSLDCVDGYAARKFQQTSKFGAWFDVIIDLLSRGFLWCGLSKWGYIIVMLEWMTFVSTHSKGPNWKETSKDFPALVKSVMAGGFYTPLGMFIISGLHVLPIWLYGLQSGYLDSLNLPVLIQIMVVLILIGGRGVCCIVELFYNKKYVEFLLDEKTEEDVKS